MVQTDQHAATAAFTESTVFQKLFRQARKLTDFPILQDLVPNNEDGAAEQPAPEDAPPPDDLAPPGDDAQAVQDAPEVGNLEYQA